VLKRKRKGGSGWEAVFIYPEEQPSTSLFGWLISGRFLALYESQGYACAGQYRRAWNCSAASESDME
jgi:hypothetical protein